VVICDQQRSISTAVSPPKAGPMGGVHHRPSRLPYRRTFWLPIRVSIWKPR
jgi:hypothetical protein